MRNVARDTDDEDEANDDDDDNNGFGGLEGCECEMGAAGAVGAGAGVGSGLLIFTMRGGAGDSWVNTTGLFECTTGDAEADAGTEEGTGRLDDGGLGGLRLALDGRCGFAALGRRW